MTDLSDLLGNYGNEDEPPLVDTSGLPIPKNVRVILNSGFEIPCLVTYDGTEMSAGVMCRRFKVKAEVDWYKYWVKTLVIGECPSDAKIVFDTGKEVDGQRWLNSEAFKYANQMDVVIEKRISV
jgi:hypothetical protein